MLGAAAKNDFIPWLDPWQAPQLSYELIVARFEPLVRPLALSAHSMLEPIAASPSPAAIQQAVSQLATPLLSIIAAYGIELNQKSETVAVSGRNTRDRSPPPAQTVWIPMLLGKHAAEGVTIPSGVELLAFPGGIKLETVAPPPALHSFVLTLRDGSCTYGHCLTKYELLPGAKAKEDSQRRYGPNVLCLLSAWPLYRIFASLLKQCFYGTEVTVPKMFNNAELRQLCRVVENVGTLHVGDVSVPYLVPADASLVDIDPYPLFKKLDPSCIISLFAALLCERSCIFVCNDFYATTAIISTLISLMSPLYWPHAFIPILPATLRMSDVFNVGIPFLLGLSKKAYETGKATIPTNVVIVDVETSHLSVRVPIQLLPVRLELRLMTEISRYAPVFSYHNPGVSYALPDNFPMQAHPGGRQIDRVEDIKGIKDISKISLGGLVKGIATGETHIAEVVTPRTLQTLNSSDSEDASDIVPSEGAPLSDLSDPSPSAPRINIKAIQRGFESVLLSLLKRYHHFLLPGSGENSRIFNSQGFLSEVPPDCVDVLGTIVKTELFSCFIQDALLNPAPTDFDRRIMTKERRHLAVIQSVAPQALQADMWKRGHDTKNWKKRTFKLDRDILSYFEAKGRLSNSGAARSSSGKSLEGSISSDLVLKGTISIAAGKTVITVPQESAKTKYPSRYPFVIRTSNQELEICADDSSTRRRFIKAIKARTHRTESLQKPAIDETTKSNLRQKRATMHTRSFMAVPQAQQHAYTNTSLQTSPRDSQRP